VTPCIHDPRGQLTNRPCGPDCNGTLEDVRTMDTPSRASILDAVKKTICEDRQDVHGNPEDTHVLIAQFWNLYAMQIREDETRAELFHAQDVAVMMALFKIARHAVNPSHADNLHDGIGYLAIAAELQ
jgi:hypothetical protein